MFLFSLPRQPECPRLVYVKMRSFFLSSAPFHPAHIWRTFRFSSFFGNNIILPSPWLGMMEGAAFLLLLCFLSLKKVRGSVPGLGGVWLFGFFVPGFSGSWCGSRPQHAQLFSFPVCPIWCAPQRREGPPFFFPGAAADEKGRPFSPLNYPAFFFSDSLHRTFNHDGVPLFQSACFPFGGR